MFKKPLGNFNAPGPLPDPDRRKLKQRVIASFGISQDEGDQLVPQGLQSIKFNTYLNKQGVAYLGPDGNPLWFTIGKGSDELIPTIYTLWKKRDLVPFVSTPPSVIRVLVGGAEHGVIQRPTQSIAKDHLVSICQYDSKEGNPTLSAPLVIGRMAISSDRMTEGGKGKAVIVLHAWKDHLWEMGSKLDVPEPTLIAGATGEEDKGSGLEPSTQETSHTTSYTPQEVTDILHKSLLQSISTIFSSLPASGFPIPSTQFYTNHILPCRPATTTNDATIKNSTHKSLTAFLKAAEKDSLLTLKSPQKQKGLLVMSVNKTHSSVLGHVNYKTVKDVEEKNAKRERSSVLGYVNYKTVKVAEKNILKQGEMEKDGEKSELGVRLLWKPYLESTYLFESIGGDPNTLYTMQEIKTLLDSYISSQNLAQAKDKSYINLDMLKEFIYAKQQSRQAMASDELLESEFIKREELVKMVIAKMQDWHEIVRNGETSRKKGTLKPIRVQVVTNARQRKTKRKAKRRIKVIRVATKEDRKGFLKLNQVVTRLGGRGILKLNQVGTGLGKKGLLKPNQVVTKKAKHGRKVFTKTTRHGGKATLKSSQVITKKKARHDKKGALKPNQVVTKARQDEKDILKPNQVVTEAGQDEKAPRFAKQYSYKVVSTRKTSQRKRKGTSKPEDRPTSTYVTGFEPFVTVGAEIMADELRWMCESTASVSPLPGKEGEMEVVVQGKQSKAALEFLTSHGVPRQWIELVE